MDNELYIVSLINAVLGVELYPINSPSEASAPFIIWTMAAGGEEADLTGPSGFREEVYVFRIVAREYQEIVDIREGLRNLVQYSSPLTFIDDGSVPSYDTAEYPSLYILDVTFSGLMPTNKVVNPQVLSASYATSASYADNAGTASYFVGFIESASYAANAETAVTAAFAMNATATLPDGLVSSSAQIDFNAIQNQPTTIQTASYALTASFALNTPTLPSGLVSSSAQIDYTDIQNKPTTIATASYVMNAVSASRAVLSNTADTASFIKWKDVSLGTTTVFSSSAQVDYTLIQNKPTTIATASFALTAATASFVKWINVSLGPNVVVSASAQIDYNGIQNQPTTIATASFVLNAVSASYAPLPVGVVSSSAQILDGSNVYSSSAQLPDGIVSSSAQLPSGLVSSSLQVLEGSNIYSSSVQLPSGLVSASAQVDYTDIQNKPTSIESASYALSASWSPVPSTASYALEALSASYAPASPSASYATNASSWAGYSLWVGTRAEYTVVSGSGLDANTLYFIKE